MISFFTREEEQLIVASIKAAELNTSGEIRVHLEKNCRREAMKEAVRVFRKLGMYKTRERNGVLIFLAPDERKFAIIGDEGIHKLVGQDFWEEEKELLLGYFAKNAYCEGLCKVVEKVGEKLKLYFPYESGDVNELSDEISKG